MLIPVKVVLEFIIAPQCYHRASSNGVRKKYLGTSIKPDLWKKKEEVLVTKIVRIQQRLYSPTQIALLIKKN